MKRGTNTFITVAAILIYLFLYAPIVVVILFSFNASKYSPEWTGFTLKWYGTLFKNHSAWDAASNTLLLAVSSTAISTVLGTLLAYGMKRYRFPGKGFFAWLLYIPVVIPDILMAVSLLLFFGLMRDLLGIFELGFLTMLLAHVTFQISFVALVVRSRLAGLDPRLEEAARDLGAGSVRTFFCITLPLLIPGIVSGALLAFTMSLDDFVVTFFTTGPGATTLPVLIYSSVKRGVTPEINALSTLMILASVSFVVIATILQGGEKQSSK